MLSKENKNDSPEPKKESFDNFQDSDTYAPNIFLFESFKIKIWEPIDSVLLINSYYEVPKYIY